MANGTKSQAATESPEETQARKLAVLTEAEKLFKAAKTPEEIKEIMDMAYLVVGWKALCRVFVKGQSPTEALRLGRGS